MYTNANVFLFIEHICWKLGVTNTKFCFFWSFSAQAITDDEGNEVCTLNTVVQRSVWCLECVCACVCGCFSRFCINQRGSKSLLPLPTTFFFYFVFCFHYYSSFSLFFITSQMNQMLRWEKVICLIWFSSHSLWSCLSNIWIVINCWQRYAVTKWLDAMQQLLYSICLLASSWQYRDFLVF